MMINFAKRNFKESVRDPMSLIFCLFLPLFFLIIFQQFNIPSEVYSINNFTPSIIVFSFSFLSLFIAQLVAKDRTSSFLTRLFASPMKSMDYILGYGFSLLPLGIVQIILFFVVGMFFGLTFTINTFFAILLLIPICLLFIFLGIFIGCLVSDRAAPGLGSLVVQLVAFTSGMWFPTDLSGSFFKTICNILPFSHIVDLVRNVLNGNFNNLVSLVVIIIYLIVIFFIAIFAFNRKMVSDNK